MPDVSVTRIINAPVADVWPLVSDPIRFGDWSPENTGAKWLGGATGAAGGARFRGSKRNGWLRWYTRCTVVECEPNEAFAFEVWSLIPIAHWAYRLRELDDGRTEVTEEWTSREPDTLQRIGSWMIRIDSRPEFNRTSMHMTLEALAVEVEA